jgi:hypothetical protein
VVLCERCGLGAVGCRREGARRWAVPGIYCASLPPSLPPSDAPRPWTAHPTCRQLYSSAPLVYEASLGSTEAELRQIEVVLHDLHVFRVSWHASRTSRGGLRSRAYLSTQHIVQSIVEVADRLMMFSMFDASCCDIAFSSTSSSLAPRHVCYQKYVKYCGLTGWKPLQRKLFRQFHWDPHFSPPPLWS